MEHHIENELLEPANDQKIQTLPGKPYPLGASWDGNGVNFAVFSENAHSVELCLFNTAENFIGESGQTVKPGEILTIADRSVVALRCLSSPSQTHS